MIYEIPSSIDPSPLASTSTSTQAPRTGNQPTIQHHRGPHLQLPHKAGPVFADSALYANTLTVAHAKQSVMTTLLLQGSNGRIDITTGLMLWQSHTGQVNDQHAYSVQESRVSMLAKSTLPAQDGHAVYRTHGHPKPIGHTPFDLARTTRAVVSATAAFQHRLAQQSSATTPPADFSPGGINVANISHDQLCAKLLVKADFFYPDKFAEYEVANNSPAADINLVGMLATTRRDFSDAMARIKTALNEGTYAGSNLRNVRNRIVLETVKKMVDAADGDAGSKACMQFGRLLLRVIAPGMPSEQRKLSSAKSDLDAWGKRAAQPGFDSRELISDGVRLEAITHALKKPLGHVAHRDILLATQTWLRQERLIEEHSPIYPYALTALLNISVDRSIDRSIDRPCLSRENGKLLEKILGEHHRKLERLTLDNSTLSPPERANVKSYLAVFGPAMAGV